MLAFKQFTAVSKPNRLLRSSIAAQSSNMLSKAVRKYSVAPPSPAAQKQQPLQTRPTPNSTPYITGSKKRKFERTMSNTSSIGALHGSTQFYNENDFDDDSTIDLALNGSDVRYPSLHKASSDINYPLLPPQPSDPQPPPPSSAAVPWSSSPLEHFLPPPSKRRTVPWLDKERSGRTFTPLPSNEQEGSPYPWNKTPSALKAEQKELRKINKSRAPESKQSGGLDAKTSAADALPKLFLSEEQKGILTAVVDEGKSIFFTGSAGTGKSVLMRSIITRLRNKHANNEDRVAITASTGLAAVNIDGTTLHSFAGIGLGKEPAAELLKKIRRNPKARQRWMRTRVLIIDEVSMIDGDLFDKLEHIARLIRNNGSPFGGIQLVVTGDFFQLPPVPEKDRAAKFSFDAATWNTCIEHTVLLTHVFRQKDAVFAGMLNEMRLGRLTPASIRAFQSLSRPLNFTDDLDATELFPTREEVERANNNKMRMLSGETMTYTAEDSGTMDLGVRERILKYFMAPKELQLKKGAQVMLIKNADQNLVNGSLGKVVRFSDSDMYAYSKEHAEEFDAAYRDQPDDAHFRRMREKIHAAVYKNGTSNRGKLLPVVCFQLSDGSSREILVQPEEWKSELPNGELVAKRQQVPLILAWALSIHKAQGQTLERVKVDLGRVFEKGQAYVALSRATTQQGLQVTRFDARKVMVHPKVVAFYDKLVSIAHVLGKKGEQVHGVSAQDYDRKVINDDDEFDADSEEVERAMQSFA
jgi:ATP-dependent DNA helicase PIF1